MTLKAAKKGPKFGANGTMKASKPAAEKTVFEITLPKRVQALLKAEQEMASKAINTYAQERNREFNTRAGMIVTTARAMMDEIPSDIDLRLSEDLTKLVQV